MSADRWIARLRGALDGKPVIDCDGNTYAVDADGESATFTDLIDESVETFPTATVLEAIEGWLAFMHSTGRDRSPLAKRSS